MVEYKPGYWLAKNSHAYKLWEEGKKKELAEHITQLAKNELELLARYDKFEKEGKTP